MTLLFPNSPPRRWDPSQWNLTRVGAAIGASLALGACTDDTTAADQGDASATDSADDPDTADWGEYDDGYHPDDGWNDDYDDGYHDGDWNDDEGWYAECYADEDCGPGWECLGNYCVPLSSECESSNECGFDEFCDDHGSCVGVPLPSQCLAPALTLIPLPAEPDAGVAVALRFVQLDDDPSRELVLLRDDAIVVIDGDQATTVPYSAHALDDIAALDVDGDGDVDLIATSSTKLNARVFLADGLGGFVDTGAGPAMLLADVHAIDWPSGGPGELLIRTQAGQPAILSNLGVATPELAIVQDFPAEAVAAGDFDGDGQHDYALLLSCQPLIQFQVGGAVGRDGIGPPGTCALTVGDFDQDLRDDLAILRADASFSVVTVLSPPGQSYVVGLPGVYTSALPAEFGGAGRSVLAQAGTALELLFADELGSSWCRGLLDELPPVARFATGDFDGDGDEELAVLGVDGLVTLWSD